VGIDESAFSAMKPISSYFTRPWETLDYIHLNPVRAGLVRMKQGQSVRDYLWSSVAKKNVAVGRKRD
jgi:hypothetical protein